MACKEPLCAFLALCLSAAEERLTARSRKEKGGPPDVKKYTLKRILTSLFTLLAILLVLFILMQLMPGSPFNDEKLTPDMRAALYACLLYTSPLQTEKVTRQKAVRALTVCPKSCLR